ncbi:phosphatase PAP2 family protein [Sutcliffiella rhizosphaerae]|uniref:Phosphatidic acid phosphatase type 2/haloperoxidase domain-containing protein n=1 Tax=Sutcliffiella rhizosphaerae TaxID=2880967 RepID=A0ABM8YKX0_9BACI|nr:phosphatase PAP2 family protein [Sutcliffiella rhizosphaerae]CAG9620511.1 hypothetical protein BACCIP111883_01280 [Sutcliffiella rhizosphaerae]
MKIREVFHAYKSILVPCLFIFLGITLMFAASSLFLELAEGILEKDTFALDEAILSFFQLVEQPFLTTLFSFITELGSIWFITLITIFLSLYYWKKEQDVIVAIFVIIASAGGGILILLLKYIFQRERPSHAPEYDGSGFSFPSGHALGSFIIYGFIIYLLFKEKRYMKTRILLMASLLLLIICIGLSRVYLHVHYPTDIIAGYSIGLIWLICCIFSMNLSKVYSRKVTRVNSLKK